MAAKVFFTIIVRRRKQYLRKSGGQAVNINQERAQISFVCCLQWHIKHGLLRGGYLGQDNIVFQNIALIYIVKGNVSSIKLRLRQW